MLKIKIKKCVTNKIQNVQIEQSLGYRVIFITSLLLIFFMLSILLYSSFTNEHSHCHTINNQIQLEGKLNNTTKYILIWEEPTQNPFYFLPTGRRIFTDRKCAYTNYFVTYDPYLLHNLELFDVIFFSGPEAAGYLPNTLPTKRSPHQKYVFGTKETNHIYPVCSDKYDGFFNWTWTYRMDSDALWGYIAIKDKYGHVVGPKENMHWKNVDEMEYISEELKISLKSKSKAAAWFVSNCETPSQRNVFLIQLQTEMYKYNLCVDIFGKCGSEFCAIDDEEICLKTIEKDYYFYFAFENSFAEDYVTEKILVALNHNTVPVVFGGANYTRFMPDGIYLDANKMGPRKLAHKMSELIKNPEEYYKYFRWKKYYSFHDREDSPDTSDYCNFCAMLNNNSLVSKKTVYEDFREWWNPKKYFYTCANTERFDPY